MRGRSWLWLLGAATAGALLLRLHFLAESEVADPFRSDAGEYARYAYNLLHHGTFSRDDPQAGVPRPDAFRSPGYPAFVAAQLWWNGSDPDATLRSVGATQALLAALLVPLTFGLGRAFLPAWAAATAALAVALSPHLVTLCGYLLTEVLYAFALLVALLACARAWRRGTGAAWAAAGALFGLASLVNETALPIPALLAGATLLARPGAARRPLALFVAVAALPPVGWALRNATVLPEGARRGSDRILATMAHGTYPGWVHRDPRLRYYAYREDPRWNEMRASFAGLGRVLLERARERPLRYALWYALEKPATLWSWSILQGEGDITVYPLARSWFETSAGADRLRRAMRALHALVLLLAALGAPLWAWSLSRQRDDPDAPVAHWLLAIGVYTTAIYTITAPWPRYAIPLRPELYLFALWSLVGVRQLGRALRSGARAPARAAPP